MARFAVLCVLFACFAVAVYSQTCDPQTGLWSQVANRAIVVDATGVVNVKGILNIADGTGTLSLDYQKSQGFTVTKASGLVTVKRTPPKVDAASQLGGVSVLVTLGLAALALVSQRGSLVALVLALAIATAVIAACSTATTLEVTVAIDPAALDKFTLKLWLDPATKACPPTGFSTTGAIGTATPSELTIGVNGAACDIVWNNPLPGCKRCPAIPFQQSVTCNSGSCEYVCDADHRLCGGNCDVELVDPLNCGACGVDCTVNATGVNASVCTASGCDYDFCATGRQDCDGDRANGCEADSNSPTACGSCKNDCTTYANIDPNSVTCDNGNCNFTCVTGKLDCGGSADGCESSETSDTTCGSCDNDCTSTVDTNAGPGTCNATSLTCVYPSCNAGFADCTPALGCETSITDVGNCGACGISCDDLPNVQVGRTTCSNGACVITGACVSGFGDCNDDPSDGCEAALDSITSCGACNKTCAGASLNAENATCVQGQCVAQCAAGFDQCDTTANIGDVGCPNDVSSDAQNCGVCLYNCPLVKNAAVACQSANCTYTTCNTGFQDCDGNKGNGCESSITADKNNCGGCGSAFDCEVSGAAGFWSSTACNNGNCSLTCSPGHANCDGQFTNGCEIDTFTDANHCNGCNLKCALLNAATQSCVNSQCQVDSCTSPFGYCGTAPNTVGCNINLDTDVKNCKTCGNSCLTLANVNVNTITCASGVCTPATNCLATHNDCDGLVANGCELPATICTPTAAQIGTGVCSVARGYTTNTAYNGFDCKSLNPATHHVVLAETYCATSTDVALGTISGTCFLKCETGFEDCNGDPRDGCENPSANCGSALTSGTCQTALQDPQGPTSCLALAQAPLNATVVQGGANNVCVSGTGLCAYTCAANYFDCDGSAKNGCEIDTRRCPTASQADCVFSNNTRCGYGVCADCTTISGVQAPGVCENVTVNGTTSSQCRLNCSAALCRNADMDWSNGCEQAQGYLGTVGIGVVDCSKDIDLTNVLIINNQPVFCDGNATSNNAGRCVFSCKAGFADCDGSPFNGCETELGGSCMNCDYQADVSCGKNKCVDCTLLEGTLGTDYANGRFASASASTCLAVDASLNERVTDYACDTSVHRLNPRFDPPNGENGACQSELCRDLDNNWQNGCESAQQYGRGRFYFYGDSTLLDSYLIPYVPNPYEDRFYDYKEDFVEVNTGAPAPRPLLRNIVDDIKILNFLRFTPYSNVRSVLNWRGVVGYATPSGAYAPPTALGFSFPSLSGVPSTFLSGLDLALLHYAPFNFEDVDEPSEAAALAIIGEPYLMPVDCVLSEWSDWGLCTYADDCIDKDYVLQTRIRTRKVITPASGGGVCHLPLVEDFYRFSHRNSDKNAVSHIEGFPWVNLGGDRDQGNFGADWAHGGGFGYSVDYTNGYLPGLVTFDIMKIIHFHAAAWDVNPTWDPVQTADINDPAHLSWTGVEQYGTNNISADLADVNSLDAYGRLLTCAPVGSCPDTNQANNTKIECNVTAWSAWSECSAACDGDWAGGVRIRTRTVLVGAARKGECFVTEFDAVSGLPLIPNAGMLYEEDWQCNDHSCSSFDCTSLRNATFAASVHIDLGADKITPTCDGRDWPAYVNGISWVDANRDGMDDNALYERRPDTADGVWYEIDGNFPLWRTVFNFSYEYRWPGHCLYECEEGWFDCDHDPRNGCETSGDFCSIDVEFGSTTQLKHPLLPWEHPHGECTIAWKHDASGVVPRDCTNFGQEFDNLRHTTGLCSPATGFCDLTCDEGYANCNGDGCVPITQDYGFCGKSCVQCDQLNIFKYGYQTNSPNPVFKCVDNDDKTDWECRPQTACQLGCTDEDENVYNGCETAQYKHWPYPDVTPFETELDSWSDWTMCSHSDECGYLWDFTQTEGVFRNVPIQTRYRRPTKSAYNGGFYPDFKYTGRDALNIGGKTFPTDNDFDFIIGDTPALKNVRGVPLVQTPFYEVRICEESIPIAPCIECTNQLVGLEEHCELSPWSDWSACSAECIDRIYDAVEADIDPVVAAEPRFQWDLATPTGWVLTRLPYQIRTRTVTKSARLGGRCPPPGDTWQLTEALSNVRIASTTTNYPNLAAGGLVDSIAGNGEMSGKASYLVDVRKCNTDDCTYPEDCDALNYWYPGHFQTVATCATSSVYGEGSRCVANVGFGAAVADGCSTANGYCDTYNGDLRDGCDTYVYPTMCGRTTGSQQCDYDMFFDCTKLPGVISTYAAPCVIDPDTLSDPATFVDMNSPDVDWTDHATGENFPHICDIRWACNASLCTDSQFPTSGYRTKSNLEWMDGCEIARNYRYPFVTVNSKFATNPMQGIYNDAVTAGATTGNNAANEGDIIAFTFWDSRNKYTLDAVSSGGAVTDNSIEFGLDCRAVLYQSRYCGNDEVVQSPFPEVVMDDDDNVLVSFHTNDGCHLAGDITSDADYDLGFGCNGVWNTPNAGMCVLNCAAGYYDADLDPRNGCETDTNEMATPEDQYVWVGNCQATSNAVDVKSDASCGADQCVNCRALPGTLTTGAAGTQVPSCVLAEELTNRVPVLNPDDYNAIQYACGIETFDTPQVYDGTIDFQNRFCNTMCADGDGNWLNGCEQGRGYTAGSAGYAIGGVYDTIFDRVRYETPTDDTCGPDFTVTGGCDKRSTGFEFPIPGAWFYQNLTFINADTNGYEQETLPASQLTTYLAHQASANMLSRYPTENLDDPYRVTQKRAFDCSILYSTELMYGLVDGSTPPDQVIHGKYAYDQYTASPNRWTFAQVHHIDTTMAPGGAWNNVCNRTTGLCNYVCQAGWDDYDLDPSNGCEADLSGPCGSATARGIRRYSDKASCGPQCVRCDELPGSYQLPIAKSTCYAVFPEYFARDGAASNTKHDYVVANVRFAYTCVTEILQPQTNDNVTAWENIVCDPTMCYDQNFKYEDGCETAVNYPEVFRGLRNGGTTPRKASFNHWFSPIPSTGGAHDQPETTYWLRDDGFVVIGRASTPPTPTTTGDYWIALFDLQAGKSAEPAYGSRTLIAQSTTRFDFYFRAWTFSTQYIWGQKNWGSAGYNIFPSTATTASYDCTNAMVPHGKATITVGAIPVDVDWTLTPELDGPWFHVNQTRSADMTQCNPGWDPGAIRNLYSRNASIVPTKYCTLTQSQNTSWTSGSTSKDCYDAWLWPGGGLCKLKCETGWANGDMDPTNGCESFLADKYPYPGSKCGLTFVDPALDVNFPNGKYNYNQAGSCGAGLCLRCKDLGGVNHNAINNFVGEPGGMASFCIDGGDDWKAADIAGATAPNNGVPPTASLSAPVKYPGDYYCTGIINELACLRTQLSIKCVNNVAPCGTNGAIWATGPVDSTGAAGIQTSRTGAAYLQVCEDRDELWETGCEVALGYNLDINTDDTATSVVAGVTIHGNYNRRIGVKPHWDNRFKVIDWGVNSPLAGFDCEILRLLPRFHTHITPHTTTTTTIECSLLTSTPPAKAGDGTCSFVCDASWVDCDQNPWNGCEQSELLCAACNTALKYDSQLSCATISVNEISRSSLCDGNQLPFDDWHITYEDNTGGNNYDDASYYDAPYDIQDWGLEAVTVTYDYVNPVSSRYTIKGLWDNLDVDYVCRVWLASYTPTVVSLRDPRTDTTIPEDANIATGTCVVDCKESAGYSDCDFDDFTGCESHIDDGSCRTTEGSCMACIDIPGTVLPVHLTLKCLSTTGTPAVPIDSITIPWQPNAAGITGTVPYVVKYGTVGGLPAISTTFPQCDTRGESALGSRTGQACDDLLCRDYDGDWENGCEFPMAYTSTQRALWETKQATYGETPYDGFDCSWISDPQPDAGGRNYGGKTWAEKYHVNVAVSKGYCIGDETLPNAGKCDIVCMPGWRDCDGDPTNGCENDESLCESCVIAKKYLDEPLGVNCTRLVDSARGFIPFTIAPTCNGREGQDGQCAHYMCNIFNGFCDSGLGRTLNTIGCVTQTADDNFCGADWNWRDIVSNGTTIPLDGTAEYDGGRMVDYGNFDGTGRCGTCNDLDGYMSDDAVCMSDSPVAGHTKDKKVYYKPAASGWISNSLGDITFDTAGNTVGSYLCQLHGALDSGDDGACDRNLCVDEDYYWANGCETAVNYPISLLKKGSAGEQRHLSSSGAFDFGFDYHFAFNSEVFGREWPYNAQRDGVQVSDSVRSEIRGIWCPFLQFWSLSTDNYQTGDCNVFPCPHFHPSTITNWITCVNNATSPNAGKCNFQCNEADGWKDCDMDPMTGCETDIFNDGTCGSGCEKVECNALDGLNPFYWSECVAANGTSMCDLSICEDTLCRNLDSNWTNGCETAVNYPDGKTYNCRALMAESELARLHLATVQPCNGEPGNHWAGKCEFTCEPGWVDCDGDFENGCEHDGSLCQDCTKALGYVTYYDGASFWQFWGPASGDDMFYSVVYGSYFTQNTLDWEDIAFEADSFDSSNVTEHRALDQFAGPNVAYSKYHVPYVAAFDCSELRSIYPNHFTAAPITCDANIASATAGRCVYVCDAAAGYFDCDGDPRNGCEHESMHEACGSGGACRNCYYISGVDYPVDKDDDGINDGSRGPYGRAGDGAHGSAAGDDDVYADVQVKYFGTDGASTQVPDRGTSPLRLGCVKPTGRSAFTCNLDTCIVTGATMCRDENQGFLSSSAAWRDGCERALAYDFNNTAEGKYFDCSLMGPDFTNNDAPRPTNVAGTPSFHVRQKVGTVGCDAQIVLNDGSATPRAITGKGAWRYILAATGRASGETEGRFAFDYDGLAELFMVNDEIDIAAGETLNDLGLTLTNFVINRVRGSDKPGTCYYECEYGYEDCNGDPRDGCEIKISMCRDGDGEFGWDWVNKVPTNGCELALGYTRAQLRIDDPSIVPAFPCSSLFTASNVNTTMPIYCRGGQDGRTADGTCQFTCATGFQDCDGNPQNGCERPIADNSCGCVDCTKLPGTMSVSTNPNNGSFAVSQSTCDPVTLECSVPCNDTLCSNGDNNWLNGCEVANGYGTPRGSTAVGPFNCNIWATDLLLAKKQHIDVNRLNLIFCEGRVNAPDAGTCSYQAACVSRAFGGFNDYQDCNGDPRDGCEDTQRWCQRGNSTLDPTGTMSDLCSKATNYYVDPFGFDIRGQLVAGGASRNIPSFDCFNLGSRDHVNVTAVIPYCDRDPTHLETRGDCVFVCENGWADCNGRATDGCESPINATKTCNDDCVNCDTLPGIDRSQFRGCVADTNFPGEYKCQFTCAGTNCQDRDGKWQNGCERTASDVDWDGVFVNQGEYMDCSVMNEEAKVNPELFRHHLHIDLSVPVATSVDPLPAGTIFCNNELVTGADNGFCYFICLPGFVNNDNWSYNGCESAVSPALIPYVPIGTPPAGQLAPAATAYRFPILGLTNPYFGTFGGYMIGDYDAEFYIAWLTTVQAGNLLPLSFPRNLAVMNSQFSIPFTQPILWY